MADNYENNSNYRDAIKHHGNCIRHRNSDASKTLIWRKTEKPGRLLFIVTYRLTSAKPCLGYEVVIRSKEMSHIPLEREVRHERNRAK